MVIYGRPISMPPKHIAETIRWVQSFGRWDQVLNLTAKSAKVPEVQAQLFREAGEVVIHTIWKEDERIFLDACPNASITLYDNGLDSHNPVSKDKRTGDRFALPNHLERLVSAYYTLGDLVPIPRFVDRCNVIVPSRETLRAVIEEVADRGISRHLRSSIAEATGIRTLIAGTAFYRTGLMKPEDEYSIYFDYASRCRPPALLKEHPRAPNVALNEHKTPDLVRSSSSIPMEFLPLLSPVERSASISSSALLSLKKVFGIEYDLLGDGTAHDTLALPWIESLRRNAATIQ